MRAWSLLLPSVAILRFSDSVPGFSCFDGVTLLCLYSQRDPWTARVQIHMCTYAYATLLLSVKRVSVTYCVFNVVCSNIKPVVIA